MAKKIGVKRDGGLLQGKVYLGNGKYKYVYAHTTKELNAKVQELKVQLGKGLDISAQRDSFEEWGQRWLKIKKVEISDKKYMSYFYRIKYFEPIKNYEISKIRTADIQDIIIENMNLSEYTLTSIRNMASQIFELAISNRVLEYNPAKNVKIPKKEEQPDNERRALTGEEQQWINETEHRAKTSAMIMMYGGLRRGELIPLLWTDIDLDNATINVNKSVETVNGKMKIKQGCKTKKSKRVVYIPDTLVSYLRTVDRGTSLLVVTDTKNKMYDDNSWRVMWESYLATLNFEHGIFSGIIVKNKKTGEIEEFKKPNSRFAPVKIPMVIPNITPHWLRHTFVTLMYLAGIDVMTAMQQAGHANIQTTMAIYTHLDDVHKSKQITKLNDFLSKNKDNGCNMGVCGNDK